MLAHRLLPADLRAHRLFSLDPFATFGTGVTYPAPTLRSEDGNLVVEVVAPGLEAEEMDVEVEGSVLTVSGGREDREESGRYAASRFRHRWDLGFSPDPDSVQASYVAGILRVQLPSPQATRPDVHRVSISTAPAMRAVADASEDETPES